jgi:hypothetical protein
MGGGLHVWHLSRRCGCSPDPDDGEQVLEFGATAERKYVPEERRILQQATDAARAWNWSGREPE